MRRSLTPFLLGAIGLAGGVVLVIAVSLVLGSADRSDRRVIGYSDLRTQVSRDQVAEIDWNNADGFITGRLSDGTEFESYGPYDGPTDGDLELLRQHDVDVQFHSPEPTLLEDLLPLLLPMALLLVAAGGVVGWLLVHGRSSREAEVAGVALHRGSGGFDHGLDGEAAEGGPASKRWTAPR
jgi:hypothetical protein